MADERYHRRPDEVIKLKAWLYDEEIPRKRLEEAWQAALAQPNKVVAAFARSGMEVIDLPKHLVIDLLKRYPSPEDGPRCAACDEPARGTADWGSEHGRQPSCGQHGGDFVEVPRG